MPAEDVTLTATDVTSLTATTVTYNGSAQIPVIKQGNNVFDAENYTIAYKLGNDAVAAADVKNANTYTCTLTGLGQYVGTASVDFTISPKALTVTAKSKTIDQGDAPANGGVTYSGFIDGENQDTQGIFGTTELTYTYKTAADGTGDDYTASSPVGTYYIIPGGLTAANYDITFTAGILRVVHSATLFAANSTHLWATFCDIYERTLPEGCTAYTISSVSGTTVTLSNALTTSIPAYTPVLVKRGAGELSQDIKAKFKADGTAPANYNSTTGIVTNATTGWIFYGNAGTAAIAAADAIYTAEGGFIHEGHDATGTASYMLRDGQFILIDQNKGLAAHRCVLNVATQTGSAAPAMLNIGTETTGIETTNFTNFTNETGAWYSLDGRKLDKQPTAKGIYINNGRKVVVK